MLVRETEAEAPPVGWMGPQRRAEAAVAEMVPGVFLGRLVTSDPTFCSTMGRTPPYMSAKLLRGAPILLGAPSILQSLE